MIATTNGTDPAGTARPPRAYLYTRLSDPGKQEENYSRPDQHRLGYALAERLGATVARVFDEGKSAETLFERPRMMELLAALPHDLQPGDYLIAPTFSRLARHPFDLGTIKRLCDYHGVEIRLCIGEMPEGEYGDVMLFLQGHAAQKERADFIERSWRALRAKAASGKPLGFGQAPFGLRYTDDRDKEGKLLKERYEPDSATVSWLTWLFTEYDQGSSLRRLGLHLEEHQVRPPYHSRTGSTRWSAATVRAMLTNPAYTGEGAAFDQKWTKGPDGRKRLVTVRPGEPGHVPLPAGVFPQVVDRALFERVQVRLTANQRQSARRDRDPEFGVFRRGHGCCGACGAALVVKPGAKGVHYYVCNGAQRGCGKTAMRVDLLDAQAFPRIEEALWRPAAIEERLAQLRAGDPTGPALAAIEDRLKEVNRRRRNLLDQLDGLDDPEDRAEARHRLDALAAQRHQAEAEREAMHAQRGAWQAGQARLQSALDYAEQVRRELCDETVAMDWTAKRRALFRLGATVTLYPATHPGPRWTLAATWDESNGAGSVRVASPDTIVDMDGTTGRTWLRTPAGDEEDVTELMTEWARADAADVLASGSGSGATSARAGRRARAARTARGHRSAR